MLLANLAAALLALAAVAVAVAAMSADADADALAANVAANAPAAAVLPAMLLLPLGGGAKLDVAGGLQPPPRIFTVTTLFAKACSTSFVI